MFATLSKPVAGLLVLVLACAVLAAACSDDDELTDTTTTAAPTTTSTTEAETITAVVVDSDGGFEDFTAITYLLECPDVEVVALTMSGTGVAHCPKAAENASALLSRIGGPDIPVACGRTTPLAGDNAAPETWRVAADALGHVDLPEPRPLAAVDAPQLLIDTIGSSDGDITLVVLGPLTNVAEAIRSDPSFLDRVAMIYLMGGAVDVGGNMMNENPAAEFNIWADPLAADLVFRSQVPLTLVPLDATNAVPVTPSFYQAVDAHRDASPVSQFMAEYLDVTPLVDGMYHWDELAAVVATDESVVTIEERSLMVVAEGGPAAGATIESADGRTVRVAVDADPRAFAARFYQAILGTADPLLFRGSSPQPAGPQSTICQAPDFHAVFVPSTGQVLILAGGDFGMFDVRTNTWTAAPELGETGPVADLVYDVDSDRAIAFAEDTAVGVQVWAYGPDGQGWTRKNNLSVGPAAIQAVYDPVTGLVVVRATTSQMWTYDVDTDTWTEVDQGATLPPAAEDRDIQLLTYDASVDRLILYDNHLELYSTWEFDIRAGRWEKPATTTPSLGLGWLEPTLEDFIYDEANQVSVVYGNYPTTVATYDASKHSWTELHSGRIPGLDPSRQVEEVLGLAMTYDPVHERILVAGDDPEDGVFAFDVATREWIILLEPTFE